MVFGGAVKVLFPVELLVILTGIVRPNCLVCGMPPAVVQMDAEEVLRSADDIGNVYPNRVETVARRIGAGRKCMSYRVVRAYVELPFCC